MIKKKPTKKIVKASAKPAVKLSRPIKSSAIQSMPGQEFATAATTYKSVPPKKLPAKMGKVNGKSGAPKMISKGMRKK